MRPKPKKRLGQNFLIDPRVREKIAAACDISERDVVLEIGPGTGELTALLAHKARRFVAVELDRDLAVELKRRFAQTANVRVINGDILASEPAEIFGKESGIKIVGNIPYYITTPIIEWIMKSRRICSQAFLTVQKEFAERAAASPGSKIYGRLSCFIQYYSVPRVLFSIKRGSFLPAPKVDSAFLRLDIREQPLLDPEAEERFFRILRLAFGQRRKTLRNTLKGMLSPGTISAISGLRPEQLSLERFLDLAKSLQV